MSSVVSITKARPALADLVEQARNGQTHVITVDERPAAELGPLRLRSRELTRAWREKRKGVHLNRRGQRRLAISDLIREGRK